MRIHQTIFRGLGRAACGVAALVLSAGLAIGPVGNVNAQSPNQDLAFDMEDMRFILQQIEYAERHAAGENLADILPNLTGPWGLRTVDGSFNNLIPGQEHFGQADLPFPNETMRNFPDAQDGTTYNSATSVTDSTPRLASHLIVNQSVDNPAAVAAAAAEGGEEIAADIAGAIQLLIPNSAPDEGLSSPTNAFMTFFGQFFDHGLDLVNKGGNGVVMMPLQQDDPLFDPTPGAPNVMIMPRASQTGTDANGFPTFTNATTPHVDQNQTYSSHPSAQVILRHYYVVGGVLKSTGRLLEGYGNDRLLDTADDGGEATWDTAQLQALEKFGIILNDSDGANIPMILADPYGNFIPGPVSGLPQLVTAVDANGIPTGILEGNLATPVDASAALRINHSFFLDVAHTAAPNGPPDSDTVINPRIDTLSGQVTRGIRAAGVDGYDDELLGMHFICGDGRCNENIALTTIHSIFHHEHNRLNYVAKRVLLDSGSLEDLNQWLDTPVSQYPAWSGLPFPVSDAALANQAEARAAIDALGLDWNGERIFQVAKFGTEMQYNRIVFDEFAPTISGLKDVFTGFHSNVDPTITAEFSQSVYRFGHSMLTQTVDRYDANFQPVVDTPSGTNAQFGLFEAFLNPLALQDYDDTTGQYRLSFEEGAGAVVRGITRTVANEIDEFVDGSLQNNLVGLPLDLGAINIARGRDVGNASLNDARRIFFAMTQDTRLIPYIHWMDYLDNLRHELSLVNFLAAYGTHPTLAGPDGIVGNADDPVTTYTDRRLAACAIVGALTSSPTDYCVSNGFGVPPATPADAIDFLYSRGAWAHVNDRAITGLEAVDFWNGGLAEERMPFGGYLGSTHNFVFENQLEHLQNGDRFYYVGRTFNIHLFAELESNPFTALAMRSTGVGEAGGDGLPLSIFSVPNHVLEVNQNQQFNAAGNGTPADPTGDSELVPLVIRNAADLTTNITVADKTRVTQYTGGDHVTINGTEGQDTIIGGIGDDTLSGGEGNDRLEGGDGADHIEGGPGDDIITDLSGSDIIEGGAGNDAVNSGNEIDTIFGDEGNDFIVNPSEFGLLFGGLGDDFIFDGTHIGHTRGGAGNDWMENLGGVGDLFQGDNGALPEAGEPPIKGHDVFIARGGDNDGDMENGDDILVDGPGVERNEGQLGFDWQSFQNDKFGVDIDLDLTIFVRPILPPSNQTVLNRYDRVEGVSGSPFADILRGTNNPVGLNAGNELVNFDLIDGLEELVPLAERRDLDPDPATGELQFGWTGGEIMLGGAGSDVIEGEGGDDIIDGDAALTVMIQTPDPAIRMGAEGQTLRMARMRAVTTASQAAADRAAADAFVDAGAQAAAAVAAAEAAATAAIAAADAAQVAVDGAIQVRDQFGILITTSAPPAQQAALQDFLNTCSSVVIDLGLQVQATIAADTAAAAVAAKVEAIQAQIDAQQITLEAKAVASAQAANEAQAALVVAEANAAVDQLILVPSMQDIMDAVFAGWINPGELSISRVIADEDPNNVDIDAAVFSGNLADYTCSTSVQPGPVPCSAIVSPTAPGEYIEVTDLRVPGGGGGGGGGGAANLFDGRDLVRNVERLQFADTVVVIPSGIAGSAATANSPATNQPLILGTPAVGNTLTASIGPVSDADNTPPNPITSTIAWMWEVELDPGTNVFTPISRDLFGNGDLNAVQGETLVVSDAEAGLQIRVVALFQDDAGVFETVISAPVTGGGAAAGPVNHVLTLNIAGNGSATLQPAGTYVDGTVLPLVAIPHFGSTFSGWGGDVDCTDNAVTMDASKTCSANVTLNQHTLVVNAGAGSVTLTPAGGTYDFGTVVSLVATPPVGQVFTGWSGAGCGNSVTMTANHTCTANFATAVAQGTLDVTLLGTGSGSVTSAPLGIHCPLATCSGVYNDPTLVTLTATADAGSTFVGFGGDCSATGDVTVTAAGQTCTATFDTVIVDLTAPIITAPVDVSVSVPAVPCSGDDWDGDGGGS